MAAGDDDVPASILEIELPAILLNESLFIELNGNLTQLVDTTSNLSQIVWNRSVNGNGNSNTFDLVDDEQERAAVEFWLLVKMIAMAVVLGLMILVTIIGKYLIKPNPNLNYQSENAVRGGVWTLNYPRIYAVGIWLRKVSISPTKTEL